jgi:hypothetical protein
MARPSVRSISKPGRKDEDMNSKITQSVLLAVCVAVLFATSSALAAPPPLTSGPDLLDKMLGEGWQIAAPGVLERKIEGHRTETFAMGAEGFAWMVKQTQSQLGMVLDQYRAHPTPRLRRTIRSLEAEIAKLQSYSSALKGDSSSQALVEGCDFSYGAHADAYPTRPTQGVRADGDAYFYNNCGYIGDTYAYAYARATLNGVETTVTQTHPNSGTNVSSYATASVAGNTNCYSYGLGRVTSFDLGISYQTADENFICPLNLTATINGPTSVYIYNYACKTVTWTSTVGGGTPGYTYAWYIDGYFAGSGSSLSRTYCGNGTAYTNTENLSLTVTDSLGWTASDTHTTYIYFRVTIDPCLTSSDEKALPQPCCQSSTTTDAVTGEIICPY